MNFGIRPSPDEVAAARSGDSFIPVADVVMDRAFSLSAPVETVWPWLIQLGKKRAGWYLPRSIERFIPASRRGLRVIDPRWQALRVGDVIPDYGGRNETFQVALIEAPVALVYRSRRGRMDVTWAIILTPLAGSGGSATATRVHLRLRLAPVRRKWVAQSVGGFFDAMTIAGLAAGLQERLSGEGLRLS